MINRAIHEPCGIKTFKPPYNKHNHCYINEITHLIIVSFVIFAVALKQKERQNQYSYNSIISY